MLTSKQVAVLLGAATTFAAAVPSAYAQTVNFPGVPFTTGTTLSTATFTGSAIGGGTGQFTFGNPMTNMWTANLNFNPGFTNPVTQTFQYTLTTTNGENWIAAGLTSQMQAGLPGGAFGKQVCSTGFGTGTCVNFSTLNTASDPTSGGVSPLVGFGSTVYVSDTYYTTSGTGQITGITNSFQAAPGPLPVLGAGAAFGFSRKLRRRIKSVA